MAATRPLPQPDTESREFWEGVKTRQFRLQRYRDCQRFRFYPRAVCPHCLSGTIYSYTGCHRPAGEAFAPDVPYIVALVDLAEGVRLMSNLIGCPPEQARVDLPVEIVFEDASPDIALHKFKPA